MSGALRIGTILGSYRIVAPLGAGGMGEVYRAHDAKLDRAVALKILPAEVVQDSERVRRFVQEARSASSLSHPNIVHVYDIGEAVPVDEGPEAVTDAANVHYIAMELVEGSTLRQLLHDRSVEPRTLLSYLAQAAEGLAKAHSAGIVHRDLKPENVMVTRDGYAKVLDFGLAKLTESAASGSALAAAPTALQEEKTKEGAVMGTIGYMSPEQAQGKPVDHRTDLFAFGCLLYEAATGRRPFTGESSVDVLHAIVRQTPEPVEQLAPTIPRALVRTIRRCLAKEPERRYQSMKDLALELHEMVDEWDTLATPSGTVTSGMSLSGSAPIAKGGVGRNGWIAIAAIGIAAVVAIAWVARSKGGASGAGAPAGFQSMQITPLTTSGDVDGAALSPDGKYLAYLRAGTDGTSLWVRQVATLSDVQVVPPTTQKWGLINPVFAPSGDYLAFERALPETAGLTQLFQIPVLGGTPQLLISDIDTPPAYSPDGKRIAFVRRDTAVGETTLLVAAADGSGERPLAVRRYKDKKEFFVSTDGLGPVWSPDGRTLALAGLSQPGAGVEVVLVSTADGSLRALERLSWRFIAGIGWLPDSRFLVVSAAVEEGARNLQLWRLDSRSGERERLTNDLVNYLGVSLTADGRRLVSRQVTRSSELWTAPIDGGSPPRALLTSARDRFADVAAASDGTLFYSLQRGASQAIWKRPTDGGPPVQLTRRDEPCRFPSVSKDGAVVLFQSPGADGARHIFQVNGSGGTPRQVTDGDGEPIASVAPDGTWFAYLAVGRSIWRKSLVDGSTKQLVEPGKTAWGPMISPTGDRVVYFDSRLRTDGETELIAVVLPAAGGAPLATVVRPADSEQNGWRWAPDGKALLYRTSETRGDSLWRLPLDGSPPTRILFLPSTELDSLALLDGGKTLVYSKVETSGDAVLIENFQ